MHTWKKQARFLVRSLEREIYTTPSLLFSLWNLHGVSAEENMGKEEELLKTVHNNDEKKLQVNKRDPEVG